jgi:Trm5-related predicted tRNA methylase
LNLQLCRSYGSNRKSRNPVHIILTSVSDSALEALNRMSVKNWKGVKVFSKHWSLLTKQDLESVGISFYFATSTALVENQASSSITSLVEQFVYLTGDSTSTLEKFSEDKIYIIGGIVDKNRHKELTLKKAEEHGVLTAKLPVRENIKLTSSSILTCNQIFELILKFLDCSDWPETFRFCIPDRKKLASQVTD